MFQFAQNEATANRRRIFFYAVDATDGYTAVTASITSGAVLIVKNGVTPGTSPVSPTFTHISNGLWYYEMTAAHLDTQGVVTVTITGTNIRTVQLIGYVYAGDPMASIPTFPTNFSSLSINASGQVTVGGYGTGLAPLQPTVAGRTLDVTTTGEAGIDWGNIGSPTTAVTFTNTTISTGQQIASVSGSVNSVATGVTVATNNDKSNYNLASGAISTGTFSAGAINAAAIGAGAITSAKIANDAIVIRLDSDGTASQARLVTGTVASDVWNALLTSYAVNDSFGQRVLRSTTSQSTCAVTGSSHIAADIHELQPAVIDNTHFADSTLVIGSAAGTGVKIYLDANSITAGVIANNAIDAAAITADADEAIADAILNRNLAGGGNGTGATTDRTVRSALRALRNKSEILGTTLTVYQENDAATAWTASVSTSAGANPVTGIDPAGP